MEKLAVYHLLQMGLIRLISGTIFLSDWENTGKNACCVSSVCILECSNQTMILCLTFFLGILRYRVDFQSMEYDGEYGDGYDDDEEY